MNNLDEGLNGTHWDVIIAGTGLREAILAAAFARLGWKVLHIDKAPRYGGEHAALSLSEVDDWARLHAAHLEIPDVSNLPNPASYLLNLSSGLLLASSPIIQLIVENNFHESLEFLKVGNWFVFQSQDNNSSLTTVPLSREDVFGDKSLDVRAKRAVVRVLKSMIEPPNPRDESASAPSHPGLTLKDHLSTPPRSLDSRTISAFGSLTLCHEPLDNILYSEARESIRNFYNSVGKFGPGFAAVVCRYGTGSEIVQTLCRTAAVTGNAVYVLNNGLARVVSAESNGSSSNFQVQLFNEDTVYGKYIISTPSNLPPTPNAFPDPPQPISEPNKQICNAIYAISDSLHPLFETKDPPPSAGALIYFPSGALSTETIDGNPHPIYVLVRNSDTGECPSEKCIAFVSMQIEEETESVFLDAAIDALLETINHQSQQRRKIHLSLRFIRKFSDKPESVAEAGRGGFFILPEPRHGLELPGETVEQSLKVYEMITGTREGFLKTTSENHD